MKIGIFDSGLGGLPIMRGIVRKIPQYDYIYLGDTKRVPYGNRSKQTIYEFTRQAVEWLFKKRCQIIIVACNTASAQALRKLQREYLPKHYPARRILGVIRPTVEFIAEQFPHEQVGVIGTLSTIQSGIYQSEIRRIKSDIRLVLKATPLLVPIIENGGTKWLDPILHDQLEIFHKKTRAMVLGCTHYPLIKRQIKNILGVNVAVISQDEVVPKKLHEYFCRHPEIEKRLSRNSRREFYATDLTPELARLGNVWFGRHIRLQSVKLG